MSIPSPDLAEVLATVRAFILAKIPGARPKELIVRFDDGMQFRSPIPPPAIPLPGESRAAEPFVPTPFQQDILDALEGKALRTDALAAKVGDRSRLFRHPGGLKEMQEAGLVAHHKRLGYYRVDAPPEELDGE